MDRGENGACWLIIHSGSRHLSLEVASWYQNEAYRQCPEGTPYELAWASGKLMDAILSRIGPSVEVLERLRPIYSFKAGEE